MDLNGVNKYLYLCLLKASFTVTPVEIQNTSSIRYQKTYQPKAKAKKTAAMFTGGPVKNITRLFTT